MKSRASWDVLFVGAFGPTNPTPLSSRVWVLQQQQIREEAYSTP